MPVSTDDAAATAIAVVPGQNARHAGGGGRNPPPKAPPTVDSHTAALGIIQPPPDIRAIVDKTAQFVARNGASFEQKILANERNNAKFGFLLPDDPYNAYYKAKVEVFSQERKAEAERGTEAAAAAGKPPLLSPPAAPPAAAAAAPDSAAAAAALAKSAASAVVRSTLAAAAEAGKADGEGKTPATLQAPEPDLFSVRVPAGLTSLDVDTIRLAAAATARCGPGFAKALARREAADPINFGFLRPQHSLHAFFQALVAAYRQTMCPPEERLRRLQLAIDDETTVLTRALRTLEWEQQTQAAQREAEAAAEKERVAMQSVDWHDFTVVETIAFFEDEEGEDGGLPAPATLRDIVAANKHREVPVSAAAAAEGEEEEEEGAGTAAAAKEEGEKEKRARLAAMSAEERALVAEGAAAAAPAVPPPLEEEEAEQEAQAAAAAAAEEDGDEGEDEDEEGPKKIVRGYVSAAARRAAAVAAAASAAARVVVSPLTGELVPVDAMAEHMRVSLLDPKWKTQRDAMLAKVRGSTKATDDELVANLVGLASRRPDVFGEKGGGAGKGSGGGEKGGGAPGVSDAVAAALRDEVAASAAAAASASKSAVAPAAAPGPAMPPPQAQFQQQQQQQGYGPPRPQFAPPPPPQQQQQWQQRPPPPAPPQGFGFQQRELPPGVDEAPPGVEAWQQPPPLPAMPPAPPMTMMMPPPPPPPPLPQMMGGGSIARQAAGPPFGEPAAKRFATGAPLPVPAPVPAAAAAAASVPLPPPPPLPPVAPFVLEPEDEFAARVGMETAVTVEVELLEDAGGTKKLLSVSAPTVMTTVSELKALLVPLSGIATNKQKLSRPSVGVMADDFSLAHYNVGERSGRGKGVVLSLAAKQRAARKKA